MMNPRVLLTSYHRAEAEEWNELQVEPEYVNPTAHLASAARVVLEFHAISCILIEVPHPSRLLTTLPKLQTRHLILRRLEDS